MLVFGLKVASKAVVVVLGGGHGIAVWWVGVGVLGAGKGDGKGGIGLCGGGIRGAGGGGLGGGQLCIPRGLSANSAFSGVHWKLLLKVRLGFIRRRVPNFTRSWVQFR